MTDAEPTLVLSYEPPSRSGRPRTRKAATVLAWVCLAICAIGTGLVWAVDVESVVATGPALVACATGGLICAIITHRIRLVALAIGHLLICVLFVGLVNGLNWGPSRAERPFAIMSGVWFLLASVLTPILLRSEKPPSFTHD